MNHQHKFTGKELAEGFLKGAKVCEDNAKKHKVAMAKHLTKAKKGKTVVTLRTTDGEIFVKHKYTTGDALDDTYESARRYNMERGKAAAMKARSAVYARSPKEMFELGTAEAESFTGGQFHHLLQHGMY